MVVSRNVLSFPYKIHCSPLKRKGGYGTDSAFIDADELEDKLDFDSSDDEQVAKRKNLKAKKSALAESSSESEGEREEGIPKSKKRKQALESLENETIFESNSLISTVIIEPFSLSRSSSPDLQSRVFDGEGKPVYAINPDGNKSSKSGIDKGKKRVKNKPAMRMKMSRTDKRDRATGGKKEVRERGAGTGTKSSRK